MENILKVLSEHVCKFVNQRAFKANGKQSETT